MSARTWTEPLTPDETRSLQLARQALEGGVRRAATAIVSLAILGPAMFGLMVSLRAGPQTSTGWITIAGVVVACMVGSALLWMRALKLREVSQRPLIAALASHSKQVTTGKLGSIQADERGGLRYQVDDDILLLRPLAAAYDTPDPVKGEPIQEFQHVQIDDIALHWIPLSDDLGLLLEAAYGDADRAVVALAPHTSADRRRAQWRARLLLVLLGLALPFSLYLAGTSLDGITANLGVYLVAGGLIAGLAYLNMRRQRLHSAALQVFTGRVTETFYIQLSSGNGGTQRHHWFRVGGRLISPGLAATGTIRLGDWAKIESLAPTDPAAPDELVSFAPTQAPDTRDITYRLSAHEAGGEPT